MSEHKENNKVIFDLGSKAFDLVDKMRGMISTSLPSGDEIMMQIKAVNSYTVEMAKVIKVSMPALERNDAILSQGFDIMMVTHPNGEVNPTLLERLMEGSAHYVRLFLVSGAPRDLFRDAVSMDNKKQYDELVKRGKICLIQMGKNLGPSIARNLVAHLSDEETYICLDDDGLTSVEGILRLNQSIVEYKAQMVRGRLCPFNDVAGAPAHYDKGRALLQNPDC